ncbi:YceD family protein [Fonticella tunisiensis]|uniref:DUF177 domain-containing protein n=1 Tax=Fonticella tunisiensis TaxID=1096341 RepID=A0A4R7KS25_9CLOT|nr:DUF177 domain-containing protein [Fonticella tunisiensis]TDT61617.1 uncharacterized protein EDD71_106101 [Fonticella tunisiensis]
MKLNISDLLKHRKNVLPFEMSLESDMVERDDFKLKLREPLLVKGEAEYDGEVIKVRGRIHALIEAQCSRCLTSLIKSLDIDFDEKFSKSPDDDVYPIYEDFINLEEMVVDNLILSVPLKFLCSEECKGLCPKCGKNLNFESCNCEKDDIDPRFAALKDLFKGD